MLQKKHPDVALRRRGLAATRAVITSILTAVVLTACATVDSLDPAAEAVELAVFQESGGEWQFTGGLDGATVAGDFTVAVKHNKHYESVSFYFDDEDLEGVPYVVDEVAPYEATVSSTDMADGPHTLTLVIDRSKGKPVIRTVSFVVDNVPDEEPSNPEDPGDEPTDPEDPGDEPTDPEDPGDEPTDPEDPGDEPTDPEDPGDEPTDPEDPGDEPTDPGDYPAPTYWVSKSGSDSNDGRSADRAFRTIRKAASRVQPGDVVYIREGVYSEYLDKDAWRTSGQEGNPITIMGAPGENVVLDGSHIENSGGNPSHPKLIWLYEMDWYVFQNLTLRNAAGRGIALEGNHHVIRDVVVHGSHGDGVYLEGSYNLVEDVYTYDNYSYNNGGDSADGLKIDHGKDNVLRRVVSYFNSDDGIDLWDSTGTLVEYSIAYDNGRGYSGNGQGFKLTNGGRADSGNVIRFNIAFGNKQYNFTDNGGGGLTMYNNTSFDSGERGFVARGRSGQARHELYNNISYDERVLVDVQSGGTRPLEEANSWNLGVNDPEFISLNPESSSFLRLSAGSPAIDVGTDVGHDYYGSAPDLGVYEFGLPSIMASAF